MTGPAGNRICQGFCLLAFGLGLSTLVNLEPGSLALLILILAVFGRRWGRRGTSSILPDLLVAGLPLLWAANATDGFLPWWTWVRWGFLIALVEGVLDLWRHPAGRQAWEASGLGWGMVLGFASLLGFVTALRGVFPLFTPALYLRVLHGCEVFFGGVVISQAAWRGGLAGR